MSVQQVDSACLLHKHLKKIQNNISQLASAPKDETASIVETIVSSNTILLALQIIQQTYDYISALAPPEDDEDDIPLSLQVNDASSSLVGLLFDVLETYLLAENWRPLDPLNPRPGEPKFGFATTRNGERIIEENLPKLKALEGRVPWVWQLVAKIPLLFTAGEIDCKTVWPCMVVRYEHDNRVSNAVIDLLEQSVGEDGNDDPELNDSWVTTRQLHDCPPYSSVWEGPQADSGVLWEVDLTVPRGLGLETWCDVTSAGVCILHNQAAAGGCEKGNVLVIGGDGNLGEFLGKLNLGLKVDVLEIDEELDRVRREYFEKVVVKTESGGSEGKASRRKWGRGGGNGSAKVAASESVCKRPSPESFSLAAKPSYSTVILTETATRYDLGFRLRGVLGWVGGHNGVVILQTKTGWSEGREIIKLIDDVLKMSGKANDLEIRTLSELVLRRDDETETEGDDDDDEGDNDPLLLIICPKDSPPLNEKSWQSQIIGNNSINTNPVNLSDAQASPVIHIPALVSSEEINALVKWGEGELDNLGGVRGLGVEIRSEKKSDAWMVAFLQTGGTFSRRFPQIVDKCLEAIRRSAEEGGDWNSVKGLEGSFGGLDTLQLRVAEYHRQRAPGPGLCDMKHYDMDSVITIDVVLGDPNSSFDGGVLETLEVGGLVKQHKWQEAGDAVAFVSHKFHSVSQVTKGVRNVLVMEFWRGPQRRCGHRCECLEKVCPLEMKNSEDSEEGGGEGGEVEVGGSIGDNVPLPFRLGAVVDGLVLWQANDQTEEKKKGIDVTGKLKDLEVVEEDDEVWDIFN